MQNTRGLYRIQSQDLLQGVAPKSRLLVKPKSTDQLPKSLMEKFYLYKASKKLNPPKPTLQQ